VTGGVAGLLAVQSGEVSETGGTPGQLLTEPAQIVSLTFVKATAPEPPVEFPGLRDGKAFAVSRLPI